MTTVLARGIDEKSLFVVNTRRGNVITTKRFTTLAEADDYVASIGMGHPDDLVGGRVKRKSGPLSTFNRPVKEMMS